MYLSVVDSKRCRAARQHPPPCLFFFCLISTCSLPHGTSLACSAFQPNLSSPGFEPGLSRPQRDVLTTRRCGQQCSPARVVLQICSLPGDVAAQGGRSLAWRAAGRRSTAEARGRLQYLVPHAQRSRPTLDIRTPACLHTDTRSKLPSHDP